MVGQLDKRRHTDRGYSWDLPLLHVRVKLIGIKILWYSGVYFTWFELCWLLFKSVYNPKTLLNPIPVSDPYKPVYHTLTLINLHLPLNPNPETNKISNCKWNLKFRNCNKICNQFFPIQGLLAEQFTDIALALGSCGNTTGMAIGNYLTDSKLG